MGNESTDVILDLQILLYTKLYNLLFQIDILTRQEHHKLESVGELHIPKLIDLYSEIQY